MSNIYWPSESKTVRAFLRRLVKWMLSPGKINEVRTTCESYFATQEPDRLWRRPPFRDELDLEEDNLVPKFSDVEKTVTLAVTFDVWNDLSKAVGPFGSTLPEADKVKRENTYHELTSYAADFEREDWALVEQFFNALLDKNDDDAKPVTFLEWLEAQSAHVAVNDLPSRFLNANLLTVCSNSGWVEFCDPTNGGDGPTYSQQNWKSWTGPNTKPIRDFLHEVLAIREPERQPHVRITGAGRAETIRARMAATTGGPTGGAAGDGGTESTVGEPLHLDAEDVAILKALADAGMILTLTELEVRANISRKTIGQRLGRLREAGLTHRPKGERGCEAITTQGQKNLKAVNSESTR